ncbi:hypothetical protein EBR37_02925 [bacterium]|nr:hypothetical protein [bacterium]
MADRIFLNEEGLIEVQVEGDQTYMTFENLKPDATELLNKLQQAGKPRLGLIDISKQGKFSADSNRAAMEVLESLNYDKLAIYGGNAITTEVSKAIVLAMGKSGNTKVYQKREEAVNWLLAKE